MRMGINSKGAQMGINDVIMIGPFRYNVLKREDNRILVAWTESTGIYKELWILYKSKRKIN